MNNDKNKSNFNSIKVRLEQNEGQKLYMSRKISIP